MELDSLNEALQELLDGIQVSLFENGKFYLVDFCFVLLKVNFIKNERANLDYKY